MSKREEKWYNAVFIGPSGCGKSSVAGRIYEAFMYDYLSTDAKRRFDEEHAKDALAPREQKYQLLIDSHESHRDGAKSLTIRHVTGKIITIGMLNMIIPPGAPEFTDLMVSAATQANCAIFVVPFDQTREWAREMKRHYELTSRLFVKNYLIVVDRYFGGFDMDDVVKEVKNIMLNEKVTVAAINSVEGRNIKEEQVDPNYLLKSLNFLDFCRSDNFPHDVASVVSVHPVDDGIEVLAQVVSEWCHFATGTSVKLSSSGAVTTINKLVHDFTHGPFVTGHFIKMTFDSSFADQLHVGTAITSADSPVHPVDRFTVNFSKSRFYNEDIEEGFSGSIVVHSQIVPATVTKINATKYEKKFDLQTSRPVVVTTKTTGRILANIVLLDQEKRIAGYGGITSC